MAPETVLQVLEALNGRASNPADHHDTAMREPTPARISLAAFQRRVTAV